MKATRIFTFSAAHHLTNYCGDCERPHGHTYRLAVTVEGPVADDGLVADFADLKKIVEKKILARVDHRDLNDLFENPTAERVAEWVWKSLKNIGKDLKRNVRLVEVKLWEGDGSYVSYEGEQEA